MGPEWTECKMRGGREGTIKVKLYRDIEASKKLWGETVRVSHINTVTTPTMTSMVSTSTHVSMTTTPIISTSTISSTTSTSSYNPAKLVSFSIEIFFHHNFPALVVKPVHLVDGELGHLLGGELHHTSTSWFPRLVVEQLDVGNLPDLLPEEVLHLLPLHLVG